MAHGPADWGQVKAKLNNTQCKRVRHNSDSGTENDFSIDCSSRKSKRQRPVFVVKSREMSAYFRLMDDAVIYDFLSMDNCKKISDKYLLAMVFAYFKRAALSIREYSRTNFFVALYLANDMEEDEEDKYEIFPWALGKGWNDKYANFLSKRDRMWSRIGYRAVVSRKCCEEVMLIEPAHWIWKRERPQYHGGALRAYMRDPEDDGYPRGPEGKQRICKDCDSLMEYDSASPCNTSWYLSSSDSSPEISQKKSIRVISGSRFNMEGLKKTLPEEDNNIWAHDEE